MGETERKSLVRIRKWLSNKKNAGILASIVGVLASEVLVAVKMSVISGRYRADSYLYFEIIWYFVSIYFFLIALCGLKKKRESIVLIFIFSQGIILVFVGIDSLCLLYSFISHPGCGTYSWPLSSGYCEDKHTALVFQSSGYGTIIYFILSCALYRTIWRGYKFLKMANLRREIPHSPIPAVCNTSHVADNLSTAPASTSTHNRSDQQQNQPPGDWPTFFDHQKYVEHERNILRVT